MNAREDLIAAGVIRSSVRFRVGKAMLRQDARGRAEAARAIVKSGLGSAVLESTLADAKLKPLVGAELRRAQQRAKSR